MLLTVIQVGIGGAFGTIARYLAGVAIVRMLGPNFPYGTLFVNITGSLLIGFAAVLWASLSPDPHRFAPMLLTGFLGGFTTYSLYALDTWILFDQGRVLESIGYAVGTAVLSIAAVTLGILLARNVIG